MKLYHPRKLEEGPSPMSIKLIENDVKDHDKISNSFVTGSILLFISSTIFVLSTVIFLRMTLGSFLQSENLMKDHQTEIDCLTACNLMIISVTALVIGLAQIFQCGAILKRSTNNLNHCRFIFGLSGIVLAILSALAFLFEARDTVIGSIFLVTALVQSCLSIILAMQ